MNKLARQEQFNNFVDECEVAMQFAPLDLPLKHYFSPGIYLREMFIPAGAMLSSLVHLTDYNFVVSMGAINIADGEEITTILAPYTGESKAGVRRFGYALQDTIWTSIHHNPDNCRDLDELEKRLFKPYDNKLLKEFKKEIDQ